MEERHHIAVVEDNAPQRTILMRILEDEYALTPFESGEEFLKSEQRFDAILLDIEMPGPNGYEVCRKYRETDNGRDTPVIFVSAHDSSPERVAAYEAGGDDFVTKPIATHELRHKVHTIIDHHHRLRDLSIQSSDAQRVAFSAMINMSDLGVVIEFLRKSALATAHSAVAARLIAAMKEWGLHGAVQVRGRTELVNLNAEGKMSPMQVAVLENLRSMGRIFEMGSRAVINYEHVSLLVDNLPVNDPEKVGRLRDHLAVLAESADMRLAGLDAMHERDLQKIGIEGALAELRGALMRLTERSQANRLRNQAHLVESLEYLARTLGKIGLTDVQQGYIDDLIRGSLDETYAYFDEAAVGETEFTEVLARLERLAAADYRL